MNHKRRIFRLNYKKPNFYIDSIYLTVKIFQKYTEVYSVLRIHRRKDVTSDNIELDGENLETKYLKLNNKFISKNNWKIENQKLVIKKVPSKFSIETKVIIYPNENTSLQGFYRSNDIFCTQCEPEGFRHITWFLDTPDIMALFKIRIESDRKYNHILSNGNIIDEGKLINGRHYRIWSDPFPKPSYLFAMVIGNLGLQRDKFITKSGKLINLEIYTEKGNEKFTFHAMESLKKAMQWDEDKYNLEYDLNRFMIVAVSFFNMGAMENKGLNIFNSKYILASSETATDQDYNRISTIVAHEYFHNWTGNRITCRDWFQLTLKEGLTVFRDQQFTSDLIGEDVSRIDEIKTLFENQFPEDNGPTSHPIRPESYIEINNFYTPTIYEKGAEIIRLIFNILGEKKFLKGFKKYIKDFDGQAVTCDDFLNAMGDANGVNIKNIQNWYCSTGTPNLSFNHNYNKINKTLEMKFEQNPSLNSKPILNIPIVIGLVDDEGNPSKFNFLNNKVKIKELSFILNKSSEKITLKNVTNYCTPSILRKFSAPVIVKSDLDFNNHIKLYKYDTDYFNRWFSGQYLFSELIIKKNIHSKVFKIIFKETINASSYIFRDNSISLSLKSNLLSLPSISFIEQKSMNISPSDINDQRNSFGKSIFKNLLKFNRKKLLSFEYYNKNIKDEGGNRMLLSQLLKLGSYAEDENFLEKSYLLTKNDNMTLSIAGLMALNNINNSLRMKANKIFFDKWRNNELVLDKWFALQASSSIPEGIDRVENLIKMKIFDFSNPNRVNSVLKLFSLYNPIFFHNSNGTGYELLSKYILQIDQTNPQLSASLIKPLLKTKHLNKNLKNLIREKILKIKTSKISDNLREKIQKF